MFSKLLLLGTAFMANGEEAFDVDMSIPDAESYLNGHRYRLFESTHTFDVCNQIASHDRHKAYLATIESEEEAHFFRNLLRKHPDPMDVVKNAALRAVERSAWLVGTRTGGEGEFNWPEGHFINWAEDEPRSGPGLDCVKFHNIWFYASACDEEHMVIIESHDGTKEAHPKKPHDWIVRYRASLPRHNPGGPGAPLPNGQHPFDGVTGSAISLHPEDNGAAPDPNGRRPPVGQSTDLHEFHPDDKYEDVEKLKEDLLKNHHELRV